VDYRREVQNIVAKRVGFLIGWILHTELLEVDCKVMASGFKTAAADALIASFHRSGDQNPLTDALQHHLDIDAITLRDPGAGDLKAL
jgi:hypothetical protein